LNVNSGLCEISNAIACNRSRLPAQLTKTCTGIVYNKSMIKRTYTQARAELASLMDETTNNREIVIIERRGQEAVAMIAASELKGLTETAHLLRSPKNAQRLLSALQQALAKDGERLSGQELKQAVGL
jgi:antitoxin YefM